MAIVYQHRRKDTNEVFYIGIGKTEKRAYSTKRSKFWKDYTSKYDYEVEIIHKDIIWEEACSIEKYLISFWGRRDLGLGTLVNQTDGGDGTLGFSPWNKNKTNVYTKEQLCKIGTGMKNKKHKLDTIEKMKVSHKVLHVGEKNGMFSKGYLILGEKNGMFGKTYNKNPRAKAIIQYDINNNFIREYSTAKEAGEVLGIARSGICQACKGGFKQFMGYIWKYKIENNAGN